MDVKTVVAGSDGKAKLVMRTLGKLQDGFIQIRCERSLLSPGTERHYLEVAKEQNMDGNLGYCSCGYVEKVGRGVSGFNIGDKVIGMGLNYAVHSEAVQVPYKLCVKMESSFSSAEAVFANLLATGVHAVNRGNIVKRDRVLVVGAGLVGQLLGRYASIYSPNVIFADINEDRLNYARECSFQTVNTKNENWIEEVQKLTDGKGISAAFICISGEGTNIFKDILKTMQSNQDGVKEGKIICVGRFRINMEFNVTLGNVDIINSARCGLGYKDFEYETGKKEYSVDTFEPTVTDNLKTALTAIMNGQVKVSNLLSHVVTVEDYCKAYELLTIQSNAMGIEIDYEPTRREYV